MQNSRDFHLTFTRLSPDIHLTILLTNTVYQAGQYHTEAVPQALNEVAGTCSQFIFQQAFSETGVGQ